MDATENYCSFDENKRKSELARNKVGKEIKWREEKERCKEKEESDGEWEQKKVNKREAKKERGKREN